MRTDELKIFTDGGARGNPGPAAAGVVIMTTENKVLESFGKYLGSTTNNQAEYQAVVLALVAAAHYQPKRINFYLDSELIVKQLNGLYKVKKPELRILFNQILALAKNYQVTWKHVYREQNKLADKQVNLAIDQAIRP